jgi:hypothetical protein
LENLYNGKIQKWKEAFQGLNNLRRIDLWMNPCIKDSASGVGNVQTFLERITQRCGFQEGETTYDPCSYDFIHEKDYSKCQTQTITKSQNERK